MWAHTVPRRAATGCKLSAVQLGRHEGCATASDSDSKDQLPPTHAMGPGRPGGRKLASPACLSRSSKAASLACCSQDCWSGFSDCSCRYSFRTGLKETAPRRRLLTSLPSSLHRCRLCHLTPTGPSQPCQQHPQHASEPNTATPKSFSAPSLHNGCSPTLPTPNWLPTASCFPSCRRARAARPLPAGTIDDFFPQKPGS